MTKNAGSKAGAPPPNEPSSGKGVVDLADARVRLNSRARPSDQNLLTELDEVRSLLDQGLSAEAKSRIALLIAAAKNNPSVLALARCALSGALEMQSQFRDSLAAVAMYEAPESRAKLDEQAVQSLKVHVRPLVDGLEVLTFTPNAVSPAGVAARVDSVSGDRVLDLNGGSSAP